MQKERFLRWYARQIKEITKEIAKGIMPALRNTTFEVVAGVMLVILPSIAFPIWVEKGILPLQTLLVLIGTISGGFTLWAHGSYRERKEDY